MNTTQVNPSLVTLDLSDEAPWLTDAVMASWVDDRAFEAEFLGCDEQTIAYVASHITDQGDLQMEVITPIGHAFITKDQAMAFFGLVEA